MLIKKKKDILHIIPRVFILVLLVVLFCLIPKELLTQENSYRYIQSAALLNDDNLIFFDSDEFTAETYETDSAKFIRKKKILMKKQNEIMVVKIHGEKNITYYNDYIEISEEDVPQYKVDLYLAQNADLGVILLPCKTAILLLNDNAEKVNLIYFALILLLFFIGWSITICSSLKVIVSYCFK